MLRELSKMEQRSGAVVAVIGDGLAVSKVAAKLGVSRQSLYRWMARYGTGGIEALADQSHRPNTVPHQMPAVLEARVLELRRQRPHWGPINLRHQLRRDGVDQLPPIWRSAGPSSDSHQAMRSLDRLDSVRSRVVLPGHGNPWTEGVEAAANSARRIGCY